MKGLQLSRKKKVLFTSIIILLPCILAFTALEIYVRASFPPLHLDVLTGRIAGPNPMAKWAFLDAFSAYRPKPGEYSKGKTVNAQGFMSTPDISVIKPRNTIRIVFLGGSSTAGTGYNLKDVDTWPWKTIAMIRKRTGKNIDFINGAVGGYTSFESYGRLWSRIRHFTPDIVVVYHGWNEMYYFTKVDEITKWRSLPDGSWSFKNTGKPVKRYEPYWIDPFIYWSQTLTRIRLKLTKHLAGEAGTNNTTPLSTEFDRRGFEIWRTNLKLLKSAAEIIGARLYVAKQATLVAPDLPNSERNRCRYEYHGFDHNAHVRAFQGIYDVIDQEIPPESIIDVTELSGRPEYFNDHIHPTPLGTTQIARIMSDFLVSHIESDGIGRNGSASNHNSSALRGGW